MKKLLFLLSLLASVSAMAQKTIDVEITSPAANQLEIWVKPSAAVTLTEITFTIKRPKAINASLTNLAFPTAGISFSNSPGTYSSATDTYEGFTTPLTLSYAATTARIKVLTMTVVGTGGTSPFKIEDAPAGNLITGTINIVDNLGINLTPNILNNANNTIIPVELVSFQAEKKGSSSLIKWSSLNELNMAGYAVERSADGGKFQAIGFEKAIGGVNGQANYQFVDEAPLSNVNYYRLVSKGNTSDDVKYSKVVSVDFGSSVQGKVYPNPSSSNMTLDIEIAHNVTGPVQVALFDLTGKQVYAQTVNVEGKKFSFNVPVQNLAAGEYIVRTQNGKDTWQQKITKQ